MSSLLQNIQDAVSEIGLAPPSTVVGSTDATAIQMLALMNALGQELLTETENGWQFLFKENRFMTVAYTVTGDITAGSTTIANVSSTAGITTDFMVSGTGLLQDCVITGVGATTLTTNVPATVTATGQTLTLGQFQYAMPSDFYRLASKTAYNKTSRWTIIGPKSAQEWQWLKASWISVGPRQRFRIINNKFALWPMPTASVEIGYEYESNAWIQDISGNGKTRFTADTDQALFPDRLMIAGAKMKFLNAKGFDSTAVTAEYKGLLASIKGQNADADTLSMAPKPLGDGLLTSNNLPDSGYGR